MSENKQTENEQPVETKPKGKRNIKRIIIITAIVFAALLIIGLLIPGDDSDDQDSTLYQQGYAIGYAEGQASRDCDCQLAAGLLTTTEWLECNPEETTDNTKPDIWNEGNTQGFFDGAEDYDCP